MTLSGGGPVERGTGGSDGSFLDEVWTPSDLSDSCSKATGWSVISLSPSSFRQEHAEANVSDVMAILFNFLVRDSHWEKYCHHDGRKRRSTFARLKGTMEFRYCFFSKGSINIEAVASEADVGESFGFSKGLSVGVDFHE